MEKYLEVEGVSEIQDDSVNEKNGTQSKIAKIKIAKSKKKLEMAKNEYRKRLLDTYINSAKGDRIPLRAWLQREGISKRTDLFGNPNESYALLWAGSGYEDFVERVGDYFCHIDADRDKLEEIRDEYESRADGMQAVVDYLSIAEKKFSFNGDSKKLSNKQKKILADKKKELETNKLQREKRRKLREARAILRNEIEEKFVKLKKAFSPAVVYSPITPKMRAGAIVSLQTNLYGIATRLLPAFLSEEDFAKNNLAISNRSEAVKSWSDIQAMWKELGGNTDYLREAIISGSKVQPSSLPKPEDSLTTSEKRTIDESNSAIIATILDIMKSNKLDLSPYEEGKAPEYFYKGISAVEDGDKVNLSSKFPLFDIEEGAFIDTKTEQEINPLTGQLIAEQIFGMPRHKVLKGGLLVIGIGGLLYILTNNK